MKEKTYLLIVVLLILGLIVLGTISFWPTFWPNPTNEQSQNTTSVIVNNKKIEEASASIGYKIDVSYPEISGLKNQQAQETINKEIKSIMDSQVTNFENAVSNADQTIPVQGEAELIITHKVSMATNNLVSVWFQVMDAQLGMAHPNNYNLVYNYDVGSSKEMQISDLFTPGSNYVKTLSEIATKNLEAKPQLKAIMGLSDFVSEGAGPKEENFKLFNVTNSDLILIFDPGTVAPEFASTQTVKIPWSTLSPILLSPPVTPE